MYFERRKYYYISTIECDEVIEQKSIVKQEFDDHTNTTNLYLRILKLFAVKSSTSPFLSLIINEFLVFVTSKYFSFIKEIRRNIMLQTAAIFRSNICLKYK